MVEPLELLEVRVLKLRAMWVDKTISWAAYRHMRRAAYAACIYAWNQHG
jgi:hypothetical protein